MKYALSILALMFLGACASKETTTNQAPACSEAARHEINTTVHDFAAFVTKSPEAQEIEALNKKLKNKEISKKQYARLSKKPKESMSMGTKSHMSKIVEISNAYPECK